MAYNVRDIKLAKQGKLQIEWAEQHMGALLEVQKKFRKENLGKCANTQGKGNPAAWDSITWG